MTVTALRRLPVPASEPPYDDERTGTRGAGVPAVQGTLALAFLLPSGLPTTPVAPPELRLVPARPEAEEQADAVDFGPQPTATADLPEARGWAGRFAQALVEVLAGDRPLAQLVRWTSSAVYDEVSGLIAGPGVAEICALVRRGARSTAVALRLEGLDGRWQCTALELG